MLEICFPSGCVYLFHFSTNFCKKGGSILVALLRGCGCHDEMFGYLVKEVRVAIAMFVGSTQSVGLRSRWQRDCIAVDSRKVKERGVGSMENGASI